jgi:itaconate CoA-transferase
VSIADISAGMYAYSGILTALLARKDTGAGNVVDVSLFDSLGEWMGYPVYYTAYGGSQPERTGASHATIAPYGPFRTRDGAIVVAVHNDQEWIRFSADVLHQPHLGTDPRFLTTPLRFEHRHAMTAAIEAVFGELTSAEALHRLETADIANARVNTVEDYLRHPQLEAGNSWRDVQSPVGPLKALRPPARLQGVEPAMGPIPDIGQHSEAVLEELGFERPLIAQWKQTGLI